MITNTPIVYVVDDDPSVRSSITRLLESAKYRVQTFENTALVPALGAFDGPRCLVLDVMLPDQDGIGFFEMLNKRGIHLPTIFITGGGDIPMSVRAIKAGAVDFLPKPFDPDQLLDCVAKALSRSAQALAHEHRLAEIRANYNSLTRREREVFASVTSGLLNKQVAAEYGISEKTIKVHRGRVMQKMNVVAFAELVRLADLLRLHSHAEETSEELATVS